jgi:UDP-perosamine 4-acetyltransferase
LTAAPGRPAVPERIAIVGAGDHGRVVMELARAAGVASVILVEPRSGEPGARRVVGGIPISGDLDRDLAWLEDRPPFVVALGDNAARRAAFQRCLTLGLEPAALVHPTAVVLGGAVVEPGAVICAAAVVGVDAHIGRDAVVNTMASVDHDGRIEEHAQIAPGAHLAGRVTVGNGGFIGIGAAVREGLRVGAWAVVAGGAMVVADVPDGARVAGVPARPMPDRRVR